MMADAEEPEQPQERGGVLKTLARLWPGWGAARGLREAFEEVLEERDDPESPIAADERRLLINILRLGATTAAGVMAPRADIISLSAGTPLREAAQVMAQMPHSRYPLYEGAPDDVIGMAHVKDVIRAMVDAPVATTLRDLKRDILFIAPSMRALDLLLAMRQNRQHMALVVDEYGGVDGLVTIEDLVEEIVGDIYDEYDVDADPDFIRGPDGVIDIDARFPLEDFEKQIGPFLSEEEREQDIETLGGFVFHLTGRVPARGECVRHDASGVAFEILDADPKSIRRLRVRPPEAFGHASAKNSVKERAS